MSAITGALGREEVAATVCSVLARHGIQVVLSGGAAASIYAPNRYESMDLDFIPIGLSRRVDAAMEELGFRKGKQRHWIHDSTPFWVEFPPGPVQIGEAVVHDFAERQTPNGTLRILTATDCVMDRLAWYYHSNDEQGLEQAVAVAVRQEIDLERVANWSKRERADEQFERFRRRLVQVGGT